jgi:hypothetical protein
MLFIFNGAGFIINFIIFTGIRFYIDKDDVHRRIIFRFLHKNTKIIAG